LHTWIKCIRKVKMRPYFMVLPPIPPPILVTSPIDIVERYYEILFWVCWYLGTMIVFYHIAQIKGETMTFLLNNLIESWLLIWALPHLQKIWKNEVWLLHLVEKVISSWSIYLEKIVVVSRFVCEILYKTIIMKEY